jgi:hypothetical protein
VVAGGVLVRTTTATVCEIASPKNPLGWKSKEREYNSTSKRASLVFLLNTLRQQMSARKMRTGWAGEKMVSSGVFCCRQVVVCLRSAGRFGWFSGAGEGESATLLLPQRGMPVTRFLLWCTHRCCACARGLRGWVAVLPSTTKHTEGQRVTADRQHAQQRENGTFLSLFSLSLFFHSEHTKTSQHKRHRATNFAATVAHRPASHPQHTPTPTPTRIHSHTCREPSES